MKSIPKSKLSCSRRENHAPSDDNNDSSISGDLVWSSESSSEGEGYATFQRDLYAMMKEARKLKKKRQAELRKGKTNGGDPSSSGDYSSSEGKKEGRVKVRKVKKPSVGQKAKFRRATDRDSDSDDGIVHGKTRPRRKARGKEERAKEAKQAEKKKKKKKGTKAEFIRVDRLWSKDEHRYVLKKSSENTEAGEYEQYAFNVRRMFDWENKHSGTCLGIMSKPLKAALRHIMGEVKGIPFEEDSPCIDPNTIFLFLEELRAYMNDLRAQSTSETKREKTKETALEARHLEVLIKYLDKDYDETKKSLYPLLESRKITFDLLWALFKSNETIYAPTYNTEEEPRAFKVDYANLGSSLLKGDYYTIEGRYLEYDGKCFGMGSLEITVDKFKGPRNISSLACYPLKYHQDHEKLKGQMIERGKKFVALEGMQNRLQKGMAFYKKNQKLMKVNVDGRVMVDPATFRRINPNYPVSTPKSEDKDILSDSESHDSDESKSSSDEEGEYHTAQFDDEKKEPKPKKKLIKNKKSDTYHVVNLPVDEEGNVVQKEDIEEIPRRENSGEREFTDEEYLVASPVVLGFSFSEKLWVEFAVSGISDIEWNEGAFDSLVIPHDQKDILKALVESHAHEAKKILMTLYKVSKGRGLVAVLHGPPGTGKTLTAEGIAELLKKPLYAVSVGELGIKGGDVEKSLSMILDIAHTWGAVLLIDEADVFLEKRELHDIGRNALVSIFLRMLEYFQGVLFLTTNRVATFDEAFQSRIHIGIRYGELDITAKKMVWKLFINKVRALPGVDVAEITEEDYSKLSNFAVNGREIKNAVRTAQSLALIKKETLSMKQFRSVLFVGNVFAKDLKGPGYEEALKFYM